MNARRMDEMMVEAEEWVTSLFQKFAERYYGDRLEMEVDNGETEIEDQQDEISEALSG